MIMAMIIVLRIETSGETLMMITIIIFLRIEISGETLVFVLVLRWSNKGDKFKVCYENP